MRSSNVSFLHRYTNRRGNCRRGNPVVTDPVERKLAAVLSADAVGYSRLMSEDDDATVRTLQAHRNKIERLIDTFRGRVVDSPGDNLLAEFPSAVGSVRCAIEVQRAIATENEKLAADRRMPFRIGIHLGDVMVEGSRIYGDGVNIAARLEGLAAPGAICLSDLVYQQVRRRLEVAPTDLGEQELKNIEGAVRVYQIEPGPSSAKGAPARAAAPAALSPPDKPSLAVLPFVNMNGDPTQEYFSDGLTQDIMAVDGSSGRHVWAKRYDRDLEDVFAVQDEITNEVVTALDVSLVGGENARIVRQQLRTPQALGIFYRGVELLHRFTREDMYGARRLFQEVIELEPDSPIGYAEMAWTYYFDVERGWSEAPSESLERMSELAHRALALGDVSGFSHLILGHMHLMRREHDEALALSEQALEKRPSCQAAWGLKANILNYSGRPEEAIPLAKQSLRLSPVAQTFFPEVLATAHYLSGRLEEAMTAAHEALALAPDSLDARVVLAASLVETGRLDAAREAGREILSIDPGFTLERFVASQPYRDPAALERLMDSLRLAGLKHAEDPGSARVLEFTQHPAESRRRVAPRPRR
jgi:adenylate cyclase